MSLIDPSSLARLAACYPHAAGRLRHNLAAEPLLSRAALANAARALPRADGEQRVHDADHGAAFRTIAAGQQHLLATGDALFLAHAALGCVHDGDASWVSRSVAWQSRAGMGLV